jgi:hypothetical protein
VTGSGHYRPSHSAPAPTNVRCYFNSGNRRVREIQDFAQQHQNYFSIENKIGIVPMVGAYDLIWLANR